MHFPWMALVLLIGVAPLAFILEIVLEVLFELILGPVIEFVFHAVGQLIRIIFSEGFRGAKWLSRVSPVVDLVLCGVSLAAGFWWGRHHQSTAAGDLPVAAWSLLGCSVAAAVLAVVGVERTFRWPVFDVNRTRAIRFALLNAAGAAGVAIGFFA